MEQSTPGTNGTQGTKRARTTTATAIWRHGYVIAVTQQHIDGAMARNSSHCMLAAAIRSSIPDATRIAVDIQTIRFTRKGLRYVFLTPHLARDLIVAFDQGLRDQLKPCTLRMRPAQISRAGKRRRECPSDQELRGSGLTVNKTQLHIGPVPRCERYNADGTRNLDPERIDGLAKRPVAQGAKVSTAHKGSIPTTLGGALPPEPQEIIMAKRRRPPPARARAVRAKVAKVPTARAQPKIVPGRTHHRSEPR